ncbi:DUF2786 domain-containing protein [Nocardioides rubriscoriae]|uniref:DUF2786 domain-containing protein n=1 Tax=Nocardioides rubriscoriae TaxID=642762 RepID=UPI0014790D07|nr:DUF2786 domain-containing protein [Nocardioides rubriscoriae]
MPDLEAILLARIDRAWAVGWQPRELVRHVRRTTSALATQLVALATRADHAVRVDQAIDARWVEQVAELGARTMSTRDGWLSRWSEHYSRDDLTVGRAVGAVLELLTRLPVLDVLIPPPGSPPASRVRGLPVDSPGDDPVLRRVRKLLAKAESTSDEHEADSLTAKAHELMTKHAIDQALVDGPEPSDLPCTVRVPIDAPYVDAKSLLLQVIAEGQRCRAIFHPRLDLSSVIGHAGDLRAVELVFTSLLVQAQHALAARAGAAGGHTRTRSYRAAFYVSFARRIGERLAAVTATVLAEVDDGEHLPVLQAREVAVVAAFDERYGESLTSTAIRGGHDALGHAHGRQAADAAVRVRCDHDVGAPCGPPRTYPQIANPYYRKGSERRRLLACLGTRSHPGPRPPGRSAPSRAR